MKSVYLLLLFVFCSEIGLAKWNVSQDEAEKFALQRLVLTQTTLDLERKLNIGVGVYPKSCYIRENGIASNDQLIIFYNPNDYFYSKQIQTTYTSNIFFRPENLRILIDGIPMLALPADNIISWYSPMEGNKNGQHSRLIGANFSMLEPFSTMFKKGATLQLQNKENDEIIAELPLKNSYNSYAAVDIHCRKSMYNTNYERKPVEFGDDKEMILPMPNHIAEKLEKEQARNSGKLWKVSNNKSSAEFHSSPIWAVVFSPTPSNVSKGFYTCANSINLVIYLNGKVNQNVAQNSKFFLKSLDDNSTKDVYVSQVNFTNNGGTFVYLKLPYSFYKELKPKQKFVIQASKGQYARDNHFKFTVANLSEVVSVLGEDCTKAETKQNLEVIQSRLSAYPRAVPHPANSKDGFNFTTSQIYHLQQKMREYGLTNSPAYRAINDISNFYSRHYGCESISWNDSSNMQEYELEKVIRCNKDVAEEAARNGYQSAFRTAKSSVEYAVSELKQRNSNNGFFSGILQGLVGAAGQLAGMEYGQDFSEVTNSINSYIRNDSYMIKMNKHVYDINKYAQNSSSLNSSSSASSSSSNSSLRSANNGSASNFKNTIDSGNYTCSGPESENMQAYLGQTMQNNLNQTTNNMCALSRQMADELRKILPYVQQCAPSDISYYEDQIAFFDNRAQGSCANL